MQPYELPRPAYALWYDVGHSPVLGESVQSKVAQALCSGTNIVYLDKEPVGTASILKKMADRRQVPIRIEE